MESGAEPGKANEKRIPVRSPKQSAVVPNLNHQGVLGFMHGSLYWGKKIRTLRVIDQTTREFPSNEVGTSVPVPGDGVVEGAGGLRMIRLDKGPELRVIAFPEWLGEYNIELAYTKAGEQQQNGFAERCN